MSAPTMTRDEMIRALVRGFGIDQARATAVVDTNLAATAATEPLVAQHRAELGPPLKAMRPHSVASAVRFASRAAIVPVSRGRGDGFEEAVGRRGDDGSLFLVLIAAPRTKKNGGRGSYAGIRQKAAYRFYRDCIVAQVEPMRTHFGLPLPEREYNCRATFYVDTPGERADFNGLNQGLHDALENAGVVTDDWQFRTCDGTRIVFGDDQPRVEVHITPR